MSQAGDYSGVLHYLKAVKALGVIAPKPRVGLSSRR